MDAHMENQEEKLQKQQIIEPKVDLEKIPNTDYGFSSKIK